MPSVLTMKRALFALSASTCCLLGSTVAMADAHSDRQALMQANNKAIQAIDSSVIGTLNRNKIKDQVQILIDNGAQIAALFGPGTDQTDPAVKPEIWSDAAGFKAADDKFIADTKSFLTAPDRIALATTLVAVQADCAACHRTYRVAPPPAPTVARGPAPPVQVAANVANAGNAANGGNAGNAANGGNGGNANAARAAAAAQGGGFIDRAPTPVPAAATVKAKAPTLALEISAAQIAARSGSRNIGRIEDIHNRMQRAINCLEGPKGADFDATVLNPCADSGNGVIPDSHDAAKNAKYQEVVQKLKAGLAVTDRQGGQQVNLDAADEIVAISSGS